MGPKRRRHSEIIPVTTTGYPEIAEQITTGLDRTSSFVQNPDSGLPTSDGTGYAMAAPADHG
jgi:hypothetical protein